MVLLTTGPFFATSYSRFHPSSWSSAVSSFNQLSPSFFLFFFWRGVGGWGWGAGGGWGGEGEVLFVCLGCLSVSSCFRPDITVLVDWV